MLHKNLKLVIVISVFALAIFQFIEEEIGNGIALLLLSGIILFFYFKNEFLLLAFLQIRRENFQGGTKWLSKVKNPTSTLIKSQQAYYYFLHGLMATKSNNLIKIEKNFKKALALGLKMRHNIALAKINLAGVAMQRRRKREATTLINEAKKIDKYGILKQQIAMMKQQMKRF